MGESFSQADLDALLGDLTSSASPEQAGASEIDKLLGDLASLSTEIPAQTQEACPAEALSGDESLSQDQIDALLKEFLG